VSPAPAAKSDELARRSARPASWPAVSADKTPLEDAVEQALDTFLYAPIGLLFDGPAAFPKLVRNGRSQVTNARMMGQFAVQMGKSEVQKRTDDLDGPVVDLLRGLGVLPAAPRPPAPAPTPTTPAEAEVAAAAAGDEPSANRTAAREAAATRTAATDAATPSVDVLPIPDYDSLSASQVVSRLRGLAPGQLEAVRAYEAATRGRKTILNRIQQLSKP